MGKLKYAFNILMRTPERRRQLGETEGNGSELNIITAY
jgi:hypothetical protein